MSSVNKSGRSPSQSKDVTTSSSTAKTPLNARESLYTSYRGSNTSHSSRSPVSPSRITRLQEKEEMQNLNDRLVVYIDTVRRLESENSRLQSLVCTFNENSSRDVSEIKKLYENELEDAKRLIDELARDKAMFEIQVNKLRADLEETAAKLAKRERDTAHAEQRNKQLEAQNSEFKSRFEVLESESRQGRDELDKLRPQLADLQKQLGRLKKQLEDETLLRVDLENKNQTLKEDLAFKSQVYGKEIDQLRSSRRVEIEQVDVRLRDEYDSKLHSELQQIREQTELKIKEMKEEVEKRFSNKNVETEANLRRAVQVQGSLRDDLATYRQKCDDYQAELKLLQSKQSSNEAKIKELEDKLRRMAQKHEKEMTEKEEEVAQLRKEIQDVMLEYQELYDIKIALDMEITAYRKLLESEEQRLNISSSLHQSNLASSFMSGEPVNSTVAASTRSGKKRKVAASIDHDDSIISGNQMNLTQSHSSECGVQIGEHEMDAKCVKLTNTSDKEVALGGWQLKRNADNQLAEYKFAKGCVIKPGQRMTVWSSGSGAEAPGEFVMSGQRWSVGDSMITILVDKDGKEVARRESQRVANNGVEKKLRSAASRFRKFEFLNMNQVFVCDEHSAGKKQFRLLVLGACQAARWPVQNKAGHKTAMDRHLDRPAAKIGSSNVGRAFCIK
ncbi:lamin Dm0 [Brachionus plicatilis]|uniref:Lamin Dm0 n=1 Tax=Brachionus plicatilis TaxID=10195 RepID=A0A3M7SRF8_BRAPC|nr:lamin Dm0 [Brachionus plicatilis]